MKEFQLKNELLLQAFWGGFICDKNHFKRCQGYFYADTGNYGRGFIEFCIAKNFNIHRVPGYEQYYIQDGTSMSMFHEYGDLKAEDIEAACLEMNELYQFVQKELAQSKYVKDGKIRLVRSLRPFEIEKVTPQLRNPENKRIIMPTNIMTSYAHDGALFHYGSTMSVIRDVPVEKVVMFDECLYHPENVCAHHIHGGEYEVWVVEDNMFGEIELDRECFAYRALDERIGESWYTGRPCAINASLYTDERRIPRPCEWTSFTKWLIKRNREKIKEIYHISKGK